MQLSEKIRNDRTFVPIVHDGIVLWSGPGAPEVGLTGGSRAAVLPIGRTGHFLIEPRVAGDLTLGLPGGGAVAIQCGGWTGRVEAILGGQVIGRAQNLRDPTADCTVLAFGPRGIEAVAVARADRGGRFLMMLPPRVTGGAQPEAVSLGIAGSDYLLEGGWLQFTARTQNGMPHSALITPRPLSDMAIRIKISTPNLKEAPAWGDFHFGNSLAASFERIGYQAVVDTADVWYAIPEQEDVVLTIRGLHRVKLDRSKINVMWLISHPDRIPADELADYDHICVASDIHAAHLRAQGLPSVSVLHQATDSHVFIADPSLERKPACLFVGNSRREYRTMVKWCVQQQVPLDLYGGGWGGILPDTAVRAISVSNGDLPALYGQHLLLLNDHWDSMRENGFLSNRLFDGSAVGTPILTDPVNGLADVFGDTISEAATPEAFRAIVEDCLSDPEPYLERAQRARAIVLAAHTFDHRAVELAEIFDIVAARKRRAL